MQVRRVSGSTGFFAGGLLAPFTAAGSEIRHSRLFHPCGITLRARALPVASSGAQHDIGARLAGNVLVRFSGAWWKKREWPDVLGCALRFSGESLPGVQPGAGDQDLLLATIRHPLTTLLAPFTTHVEDFLANDYFGVSPFRVGGLGDVMLRLTPERRVSQGRDRQERLLSAIASGNVPLVLEARRSGPRRRYEAVAIVELIEQLPLRENEHLRFDPFQADRGFTPVGFVQNLRVAAYKASQIARKADH
jgi:hypothetical protein